MPSSSNSRLLAASVMLLGVLHSLRYRGHFSDDGFIALRYAQRLARGKGLSWNDGHFVEGYSDLLWVVLIGIGNGLGIDGLFAARALGLFGLVIALGLLGIGREPTLRLRSGGLALAASGGLAGWAMGGLEQTFLAGLTLLLFVGSGREWRGMLPLAAMVCWVRVDAFVLVLAIALVRKSPRLLGAGVGAVLLQLALRLWLYGDWLPNTVRVKVSLDPWRSLQGLEWVGEALAYNGVLVIAALVAAWGAPRAREAVFVAGVWCLAVGMAGGDIFNGFRQLVPILPLLAFAFSEGAAERRWRWTPAVAALYAMSQLFSPPVMALTEPGWALEGRAPAELLRVVFADRDPLLAVDAAGVLPYTTGFRTVDMLGLNDRYLATHPPKGAGGAARIGHDLGDGAYLDDLHPDLVAFCSARGALQPCFVGGQQWVELPGWEDYQPLWLDFGAGVATYFVRRDGVLGEHKTSERWTVPASLLSDAAHPARLKVDHLVVELHPGDVLPLRVPPGWQVENPSLSQRGELLTANQALSLAQIELLRAW